MKILLRVELTDHHRGQIRSAVEGVELVMPESEAELLKVMPRVEVVFGSLSPDMFRRGERLRWVQTWGAGVDGQLFKAFVDSNVVLTSGRGTVGVHLAEHAMALLLGLTRGIAWAVQRPGWDQRMAIRNASWELVDRTMGIVGLGGTGRELAIRASAFGMRVAAVDPEDVDVPECVASCWKMDRFHHLLTLSDVVAVCAPLTPDTRGMFDEDAFRSMKSSALLINVTRGGIMDESALVGALAQGLIAGAGLDVAPVEPLPPDHPLWKLDNVLITPHTAGGSPNRQDRIVNLFCENLKRLDAGQPLLSVIDKKKGY
jgi:phosphoglycerate dehydrogenase-like enzyme